MFESQIKDFWEWFEYKSKQIGSDIYDQDFLNEIDTTISNWELGWEIGPGISKPNSLTISPNGNIDLIEKVNEVVHKAPTLDEWEIFSFKQPKENWHSALVDSNLEVNAQSWTYQLLAYPDEKIEILVNADNIHHLPRETKDLIVDLVITNLLGEKIKMFCLDYLTVVDKFDTSTGITQIKYLSAHLASQKKFT